jgi:DNA-binding NarL/FixJ family response regulator
MKNEPIRIMIVDDHKLVRETWKMLLQMHDSFEIVGECANGAEAIDQSQALKPDIILMDINMSPVNGFEATKKIIQLLPESRIIGLSVNNQVAYARKMLQLGAKGYVTKHSSPEEMIAAIIEVVKGNVYICKEIYDKMKDKPPTEDD